jgi:hypothetical protein
MRSDRISPDHTCKTTGVPRCWHVEARLPSGETATFAVRDDASFGAHTTVSFEYPGVEILGVTLGRPGAGSVTP